MRPRSQASRPAFPPGDLNLAAGQVQPRITAVEDMFMTFRGQQ
jgi:hypothetical protein